jgi:hypothetical protein
MRPSAIPGSPGVALEIFEPRAVTMEGAASAAAAFAWAATFATWRG